MKSILPKSWASSSSFYKRSSEFLIFELHFCQIWPELRLYLEAWVQTLSCASELMLKIQNICVWVTLFMKVLFILYKNVKNSGLVWMLNNSVLFGFKESSFSKHRLDVYVIKICLELISITILFYNYDYMWVIRKIFEMSILIIILPQEWNLYLAKKMNIFMNLWTY